ncbi:MAG: lipocalin-like domain-containing protein [Okeania sp. SIO2C9]|uniref:lipocalin-like domain-containing protein n=1 Tax=Okeania sp. SIO2C9 TaxID=2607791 RepID=UPI0013BF2D7E|nr:lipocalin-like domain-containing protein [Okeania sp. SIO2C9]NEQ71684.1 lipocalin-like domain-containing protein [Okeania sp. SIO2C9]
MVQNRFVGTWRLVSFELKDVNGEVTYPYGQDTIGYLMYAEDGYMSAVIMAARRPKFSSADFLGGSTQEKANAMETYISYCGSYEIKDKKVIHHVKASLFPNWVGTNQKRFFEFRENYLLLTTPSFKGSDKRLTGHLIWERCTKTIPT